MRTRLITWSGVVLLACGAYVVGQQDSTETPTPAGPFVIAGGESDILLDTKTGRTWLLSEVRGLPRPVWLPMHRAETSEQAAAVLAEAEEQWQRKVVQERRDHEQQRKTDRESIIERRRSEK